MGKYKLSIIIPCYNAEPYIGELLEVLSRQIVASVQVIVIDDGSKIPFKTSYEWVTVIRQANGGASAARNRGLDYAKGEYIAFIDADDLVSEEYIAKLLEKIEAEKFDYCYLSWRTLPGGWHCEVALKSVKEKFPPFNLCVWNRVYKRSMIGDVRFNTKKLIAEDAEFIRAVKEEGKKKAFIGDYMYYYRSTTPGSLTKKFGEGKLETRRVVYHLPVVTKDMTYLIDEFRETDKEAEVILMTNHNEIPELAKYAMVIAPVDMRGTELRGEPTRLFHKIDIPKTYDIIIWTKTTFMIGGIETFIYNFCYHMYKYYKILVLYKDADDNQLCKLKNMVDLAKFDPLRALKCNSLIINRISDSCPQNVKYGRKIQMCHTCKIITGWRIPQSNDERVIVSKVAAESFGEDAKGARIINNLTVPQEPKRLLMLVSATRLGTFEKGERRIGAFAKVLKDNNIPFLWLVFSEVPPKAVIDGVICMKPTLEVAQYIKRADYLVALSDSESFGYSIVEAMEMGTPVITTPIAVLDEIGFKDGETGYVIPFDVTKADNIEQIYTKIPKFTYKYDNESRIAQWRELLDSELPIRELPEHVAITARVKYRDLVLDRDVQRGERLIVTRERAYELVEKRLVEIEEEV